MSATPEQIVAELKDLLLLIQEGWPSRLHVEAYIDDIRDAADVISEQAALLTETIQILDALLAEEMIYTGAIKETPERSGMHLDLTARVRTISDTIRSTLNGKGAA